MADTDIVILTCLYISAKSYINSFCLFIIDHISFLLKKSAPLPKIHRSLTFQGWLNSTTELNIEPECFNKCYRFYENVTDWINCNRFFVSFPLHCVTYRLLFLTGPTKKVIEDGKLLPKSESGKRWKVLTLTFTFLVGVLPSSKS